MKFVNQPVTAWSVRVLFMLVLAVFGAQAAHAQTTTSVKRVLEGDTFIIQDGRIVRLIGVVAPKLKHGDQPGQYYAEESKKALETYLAGKSLELILENQNASYGHKDKDGRLLAYVYVLPLKIMVNREMLRQGAVYVHTPHFNKTLNDMYADQYQARKNKRGVWAQMTESPEESAAREGRKYVEPPFVLEPEAGVDSGSADAKGPSGPRVVTNDTLTRKDPDPDPLPELNPTGYAKFRVESCAILDVTDLGAVTLIGVRNKTGKVGEPARLEVEKLVRGKKLRFEFDELNLTRGHRDKEGNILVYAFLPDGSLLNLTIVATGIADADHDWNFSRKPDFIAARDEARVKGKGPQWANDIIKGVDPEKMKENLVQSINKVFGQSGGRVELLGNNKEVLRISHDLMDQKAAENIYKGMGMGQRTNFQYLRSIGIKEIQFTDIKVTKMYRFQL